ncbi:hypothetical protein LTR78_007856 [Recurvomyces mirabilis]|uniref:Uncharacterized protein n=1 Tax=Recurvomyces mirabilis TaxID=574656 RepID=A0AAE0WJ72_9PEZI|nr:hypothetical protein LTR78_007856 [Recurvomyces mirabilis]
MAPMTTLLSQYQLLLMLCDTLSTADILSLGATSNENHVYIHGSKVTFDRLISTTHCSGRGIVAQARVFGEWRGDAANATNCRFHFRFDIPDEEERREEEEAISYLDSNHPDEALPFRDHSVNQQRARELFWAVGDGHVCQNCAPLINSNYDGADLCTCDFYEHFIGSRWLCISCFQREEAKAFSSLSVTSEHRPEEPAGRYITVCLSRAMPAHRG